MPAPTGLEEFGPDYIIAVEIRTLDDYGMYSALGFENQDYGNRNAHYNEIVEAARDWFDEVIFERWPTWEAVEESRGQICPLGLPSYDTLFQAFGANKNNIAGRWAQSVNTGIGDEVLSHFIASLTARQIKEAMSQITPSPRREQHLAREAEEARQEADAAQPRLSE